MSLTKLCFWYLSKQLNKDLDYAWSWQSNIAMLMVDAGVEHRKANECAADFMLRVFNIDVKPLFERRLPK